ncbi:MAG: SDR family NAD(P)-dependent oxidoreductase [Thermodesulfobacteriota bacterium]
MKKPVCAIIGVGPGNGISFAKKFSKEGYQVALCSRNLDFLKNTAGEIANTYPFRYDVLDVKAPNNIFSEINEELGPVDTLIYNAGAGQFANIDKATVETFQSAWEVNARGLFLASKAVLPDMRKSGRGNIVVIGATASLRGNIGTVPFASAKAAQRSLAQSLAKQLGPENIHVSYVIVDGVIGLERTRENMPDKPDEFFMDPDEIAESVYFLTRQPRSAWTFELDLRPFVEKW